MTRKICLLIGILTASGAQARNSRQAPVTAEEAARIQQSSCYPADAPKSWPICLIYLHGLFPKGGSKDNGYVKLEVFSRRDLNAYAETLRGKSCRVAVPNSETIHTGSFGTNR